MGQENIIKVSFTFDWRKEYIRILYACVCKTNFKRQKNDSHKL